METSLTTWRKNAWLSVTTNCEHKGIDVVDFLELLKYQEHRLADLPFRKYIISKWCGPMPHCQYQGEIPDQTKFWMTVGPLMTHLSIKSTHLYFICIRKVVVKLAPNLQFLELSKNHYYFMDEWLSELQRDRYYKHLLRVNTNLTHFKFNLEPYEDSTLSWLNDMILHFPNIRILEPIQSDPRTTTRDFIWILQTLQSFRKHMGSHYLKDLSELHLLNSDDNRRNTFTLELASALTCLQFPLKVLKLDVGSETELENGEEALQKVLEGHSETLEELVLAREVDTFSYPDFPFGIQLPKLVKFSSTGKLVENLEFLKKMPNLEFLYLEQEAEEITLEEYFWSDSVVFEKLKQFKITNKFCSRKQISTLGKMMPNLTNITIGFKTSSGFRTACNVWKNLIHMNIYTVGGDEDAFWNSKDAEKYIRKNIQDLKHLKYLKIGEFVKYEE
ncbi:unnamed protein product [Orchesella dallaii]